MNIKIVMNILFSYAAGFAALALALTSCGRSPRPEPTLKDHFKNDFLVGAAVSDAQVRGECPKADSVFSLHFNAIEAENCMKSEKIHPEKGVWFWDDADRFMKYAEERDMAVVGHTLIWHSQLAPWFAVDSLGNDVTPEELKSRMKEHITTLMTRYKGRVLGWDVVNEAIEDDGSFRQSPFYRILGEEYIPLAFEYARDADPDAELYINDYNMSRPEKREAYVRLVDKLKRSGLRVDAIGMQGHMGIDYPDIDEFEKSIEAFAGTGCQVCITEWDMSALPTVTESANVGDTVAAAANLNPYPDGLPEEVERMWNLRMRRFLDVVKKYSDCVSRINVWGIEDGMSWKNDFPIPGRTDYPLFFDRSYNLKPFLQEELKENTDDGKNS